MNIAIVDDEREQSDILKGYIDRYFGEHPLSESYNVAVFTDGDEIIKDYEPKYDIIFLDIEMPRVNGMKAARVIRQTDDGTALIFVTRLARYALKGYDVSALDFMVKPVDYYGFALKMKKAVKYSLANRQKYIVIKNGADAVSVSEREIYYVEIFEHNIIYHTERGDFKIFGSLKTAAEELSDDFVPCNRCYLVNMRYIEGVTDNMVTVHGEELIISRYKRKALMDAVVAFWGKRGGGGGYNCKP